MRYLASISIILLAFGVACHNATERPRRATAPKSAAAFQSKRLVEATDLGSLSAKGPKGALSTCNQFSLAAEDTAKIELVKKSLESLNLENKACDPAAVVGICEVQTTKEPEVTIYTDIYYYAPVNTAESAKQNCASAQGRFHSTAEATKR